MELDQEPESPDWWLVLLGRRLRARQKNLARWRKYYKGDHPLPVGPRKVSEAYLDFQKKARTNFCRVVVQSSVNRLLTIGVTDANGKALDDAWYWWQANRLDSRQKQTYRTALSQSIAYMMVGPHPTKKDPLGRTVPLITPEHPSEVIVDHDPATWERRAGLKAFYDPVTRTAHATVWTLDHRVDYLARGVGALSWGLNSWDSKVETENKLKKIPIVPYSFQEEIGEEPEAEFEPAIDIQDRINLGMLNRMTAERYSAFRQKYVTGHKFKRRMDPATGLEILDPSGQPQVEQPFRPDPGAVWASEGEQTKFGEFSQTDLLGYLKTHQADVQDLLVTTSTPAYLYAGDMINIATDTVVALDVMHVAKVQEYQVSFGESHEDTLSLAALVAGSDTDFTESEIRWADPRQLNPAVVADQAVKRRSMGYPLEMVAEDMGESPQRIKRLRSGTVSEALTGTRPIPAVVVTGDGGQ